MRRNKDDSNPNLMSLIFPQERQRLETILNLCAEYNKGESTGLEPLGSGTTGFPGVLTDGLGQRPSENVLGGTPSSATLRLLQKQRESDEENLKEECSSTESTHQEVRTSPAPSTASLHNGDRQVRGECLFPNKDALCMPLWNQHVQTMCSALLNHWFLK